MVYCRVFGFLGMPSTCGFWVGKEVQVWGKRRHTSEQVIGKLREADDMRSSCGANVSWPANMGEASGTPGGVDGLVCQITTRHARFHQDGVFGNDSPREIGLTLPPT